MRKQQFQPRYAQQKNQIMKRYDPNSCRLDMLFHYTSLEKLALILKNRTIRLNPLNKMDDKQEQRTADVPNIGKFVFVSAWTAEKDESIPMWMMYTDSKAGVRIGLPPNPFRRHKITKENAEKHGLQFKAEEGDPTELDCFLDPLEMMSKGYVSPQAMGGNILFKVQYTNDKNLLEPKVKEIDGEKITGYLGKLGKHKNTYWSFQKEWRYLMQFIPMKLSNPERMEKEAIVTTNRMLAGLQDAPIDYYDLEIDPESFSKMEIVISPQMTKGNQVLLDSLVEKYNPSANIKQSALLNLI